MLSVTPIHPVAIRRRVSIRGVVQGVGFRPFVYNLAQSMGIRGFIFNSTSGVTIEAEGLEEKVRRFLDEVVGHPPPLARIEEVAEFEAEPAGDDDFQIRESLKEPDGFAFAPADVAICLDCLHDIGATANRRFAYPFTNCTNCGPRYSILRGVPYDRSMTTMANFLMCAECDAEYRDPQDRRFHAQPNACPICGPSLVLVRSGAARSEDAADSFAGSSLKIMQTARRLLHEGAILAVKGLGGFQLACDAGNNAAVRRLRASKKRSDKPFALMVLDTAAVERICEVSAPDRALLLSPEHPIVVLRRGPGNALAADIAPGNQTVGVMLAYTPLHFLLFGDHPQGDPEFTALVMTSGNLSDEPIVISNQEACIHLNRVADWFLLHNRDIHMRVDDSLARTFEGRPLVLRRSRGYVPQGLDLGSPVREILACGGQLKSAFCLTKGRHAILSQHIGDLENFETLQFYRETLENLKKLFQVHPEAVACDLHPLYLSTRLAEALPLPKIGVQHHHAHIASCMAENRLEDKVIGVAFDGSGYGADGRIWGGEFLVCDLRGFARRAHFRYILLPGGDSGVRQTWRSALSWLQQTFGNNIPPDLPLFRQVQERDIALVSRMLSQEINTVPTSSCGRLFDAVASILGLRQETTFEGQAAIELEMAVQAGIDDGYPFEIDCGDPAQVDMRPAIRQIVQDVGGKKEAAVIAARFHNTVAAVIVEVCRRIRRREPLKRVCLSGGSFQNMRLLEQSVTRLRQAGFDVFLHSRVPPNDGGIALGQAVIANQILQSGA